MTDLHEAILKNSIEHVAQALEEGVPIDLVDHVGQTPLFYACQQGSTNIVDLLLSKKASHQICDQNGFFPLHIASKNGHTVVVLTLLLNGADPNVRAHDLTSPLYLASYEGKNECVYHLTAYGARVNDAKNSGASPLFVASRNGHERIVERLIRYGADPTQTQGDWRSPLHTALIYNRTRCAKLLLQEKNLDQLLSQSDIYGWNSLHFLAKKGSIDAAQFFFDYLQSAGKSTDLHQKDQFGNTALHIAIFNGKNEFAEYLIEKGLKNDEENFFGWTYDKYLSKSREANSIDPSLLSTKYLKCLLSECVIPLTSEIELIRFEVENYIEELVSSIAKLNSLFANSVVRSGSYYEGTRVGLPDEFDYLINLTEFERLTNFVESDDDPSGFGRLYPNADEQSREILSSYIEPITGGISSEKVRKQFYQLLTSARVHVITKEISSKFRHLKFEWTSDDKRCGTAIHTLWFGQRYPSLTIKIDVVPCITIHSWPKSSRISWPFPDNPQFQIIPRSPTVDQTSLWRISTSKAESNHFHSLLPEQINGYRILKIIRMLNPYECLINKDNYISDDLITSYMFKNEFLYEIARCPSIEQWKNGSLIHRILTILKHLHKNLSMGLIKSFYIKDYNVIDMDDYAKCRLNQLKYISILHSKLKQKISIHRKLIRSSTVSTSESKTKKRLLRERAITVGD